MKSVSSAAWPLVRLAVELGADVCIAKPIDKAVLFETIDKLMEPKRGVRGTRRKKGRKKAV